MIAEQQQLQAEYDKDYQSYEADVEEINTTKDLKKFLENNSNIKPKKDLRDQSFRSRVRGRKEVGRIGATYKYGEY